MAIKYVTGKTFSGTGTAMVIFPRHMEHNEVAKLFAVVESAGFIEMQDEKNIYCYGGSTSLRIGTKEMDNVYARILLKDLKGE